MMCVDCVNCALFGDRDGEPYFVCERPGYNIYIIYTPHDCCECSDFKQKEGKK